MSELEGEKCQNSSPLQRNFISTNYATTFTFCEMAQQDESKSLQLGSWLTSNKFGAQTLYILVRNHSRKL